MAPRFTAAPLFDRLVNEDVPGGGLRSLGPDELRDSLRRELERLLNTTAPRPQPKAAWTVLEYGVPELSKYSPQNPQDRRRLAAVMAWAIHCFEPRLQEARVQLEAVDNGRRLVARVSGTLVVDEISESVSFPIHIQHQTG